MNHRTVLDALRHVPYAVAGDIKVLVGVTCKLNAAERLHGGLKSKSFYNDSIAALSRFNSLQSINKQSGYNVNSQSINCISQFHVVLGDA